MDFCFSKPFRHRKQLPSLCTPWISASVSRLGTGSSFPAIILHKSKHLRRIYLIKSTDVPKRPEITAYLRGTYLMKSSAVPNSLKPLHTCREQISNNPLLYLSSRITVLIYSEQRSSRRRLTPPTSHTTVQADPHTAVQLALHDCSRKYISIERSPNFSSLSLEIAKQMGSLRQILA